MRIGKFLIVQRILVTVAGAGLALAVPFSAAAQAVNPNAEVEAQVRAAFADHPEMIQVAKCESGFRQFSAAGVVLRGGSGNGYLGIFQIGERLHAADALAKGEDVNTIQGNIAYAVRLYAANGISPWRDCAPVAVPVAMPVLASPGMALTADLRLGMTDAQVLVVQRMLNAVGFTVAPSGVGSPGNETDYFGSLTRGAVRRFQCAKMSICDGSESTNGYGRVGPRTRAALLLIPGL